MLIDVLPEIFENLSMVELLRCRQVCRAWRYVVDRYFLGELCLYWRSTYAPGVWAIGCKPIDRRTALTIHGFSVLSNPGFQSTFRNLKRLMIRSRRMRNFNQKYDSRKAELPHLAALNDLHQLEHLELYEISVNFELPDNERFGLKSPRLKRYFYQNGYQSDHQAPPNLEVLGYTDDYLTVSKFVTKNVFEKLNDHLKVLITNKYSPCFLLLTNLEQLHLFHLKQKDQKPTAFFANFPRLLRLDIFMVDSERHLNELLAEVNHLKPGRRIQFNHQCFEVSDERFKHCKRHPFAKYAPEQHRLKLNELLAIASANAELLRPFLYFQTGIFYEKRNAIDCKEIACRDAISLNRRPSFAFLKQFRNISEIYIRSVDYAELRSVLVHLPQALVFKIECDDFDEQFFADLSSILENLIILRIHSIKNPAQRELKSLHFLRGFKRLLQFCGRFEDNKSNQRIVESIDERDRGIYTTLAAPYDLSIGLRLKCQNYRR